MTAKTDICLWRRAYLRWVSVLVCCLFGPAVAAEVSVVADTVPATGGLVADRLLVEADSTDVLVALDMTPNDTIVVASKKKRFKELEEWVPMPDSLVFSPDPMRAVWYSALCPGLGQIYNRRYWKLPVVIGGYMGLIYATSWNGRYYTDYSNAYSDIMDNDPTTNSFVNFLPYNRRNDQAYIDARLEWLKGVMKRKKDFYRRNRDLCIISMVGLYVVAMIDAYVDAQLYHFDISSDITMHLLPAVMEPTPFSRTSLGLQCAITF
ncbi:MAG: hypothetical protein J1E02_05055 [Coprobacter sp.]|nr:hypothetical protein [Coprobacter sp.]